MWRMITNYLLHIKQNLWKIILIESVVLIKNPCLKKIIENFYILKALLQPHFLQLKKYIGSITKKKLKRKITFFH